MEAAGSANLEKVDHIVILMLENRSFDHMLGYLSLEGDRGDIDGLQLGLANRYEGHDYPIHHLDSTVVAEDPDHSAASVDLQLGEGRMDGFVASYAATMRARGIQDGNPAPIMGYYGAEDVPVYDHLAREFAICDHWFSSVPGATWPNRLYALSGRAAGSRDDRPHNLPPLYDQPSFVRHLDRNGVSWRWYSTDVGTLRLADQRYCLGHHGQFAYFTKSGLPWKADLNVRVQREDPSFLDDAASGSLPSVSWIDPSFGLYDPLGLRQNDDHPPADIRDGQDLVLAVYTALATGPLWHKTLLVVFYDEHGGFFDHVPPPEAVDDDPGMFGRYGVRVPAMVISPWVQTQAVSKTVFDHTSVIKTVLLRFCADDLTAGDRLERFSIWLKAGHPHYMGSRVAHANDFGHLLTNAEPRPAPSHDTLLADAANRASAMGPATTADQSTSGRSPTDLQLRFIAANRLLRSRGHPADRP